jgi:hypothetical protein
LLAVTIERQRAGMAVHGPPPTIVSVEESLAEDGKTIVVIVGVTSDDDGGLNYIASSFDFESGHARELRVLLHRTGGPVVEVMRWHLGALSAGATGAAASLNCLPRFADAVYQQA